MTASPPFGARVESLDDQAEQLVAWARGEAGPPARAGQPAWLLAYCDGGIVWGHRRTSDGHWALSGDAFPVVSPGLQLAALQEMRMFGPDAEIRLWRTESGFPVRVLGDDRSSSPPAWGQPFDRQLVLLGERTHADHPAPVNGFTVLTEAGGSRQAVPVECPASGAGQHWPARLQVRHYLERVPSGAVRLAATRLLAVTLKEPT